MPTLRLIDPDGYTVPGTVHSDVPAANEATVRDHLLNDIAPQEAAQWADFGHHAGDYRVLTDAKHANDLITVTAYHNQCDADLRFLGKIVVGSRVTRGYEEFEEAMSFFRSMPDTDYITARPASHWNDKD